VNYIKGAFAVLLFWYLTAWMIASPIIPFPHLVIKYLIDNFLTGSLHLHVLFSLYRIVTGIAIALLLAIPTGMFTGRIRALDQVISPVLYLLYPLPKIAFLPVFMVLFGIGDISKIILIALIIYFPTAVHIRDGVKSIPLQYFELGLACRLSPKNIVKDIMWPAMLPQLFSSLRITLGISLSVLFVSENYAATYGMGYHIMNNWVMANYIGMYGGIVLLSCTGLGLYILIDTIEHVAIPYKNTARRKTLSI